MIGGHPTQNIAISKRSRLMSMAASCNQRTLIAGILLGLCGPVGAQTFNFSTGSPDGRMAAASRQQFGSNLEIETGDDFILSTQTTLTSATFTGLLPVTSELSEVQQVTIEIYRIFPLNSNNPPDDRVPTRDNSPSNIAFATRDSSMNEL